VSRLRPVITFARFLTVQRGTHAAAPAVRDPHSDHGRARAEGAGHDSQIIAFRQVVDAERDSFRGDFSMDALFTLFAGSVVVLVMAGLATWWGTRTFQRENA
jgi:hypothetical protein